MSALTFRPVFNSDRTHVHAGGRYIDTLIRDGYGFRIEGNAEAGRFTTRLKAAEHILSSMEVAEV